MTNPTQPTLSTADTTWPAGPRRADHAPGPIPGTDSPPTQAQRRPGTLTASDRNAVPAPMQQRAYTSPPGGQPRCGRCGQPIRSCGIGDGFEHLRVDSDGTSAPTQTDHLAWWGTDRDLRQAIHLN
jgi:hypothetical protein